MTTEQWTVYDACACVEGFDGIDHDEDTVISAWQHLIDTGAAWSLQGWYGRAARQLIMNGVCHAPGDQRGQSKIH